MKSIKDININNKIVILRCDLNVSLSGKKIVDDTRIKKSLETISYILDNNAKLIIMSHLGKIKTEEDKEQNNMLVVYNRLNELLPNKIEFIDSTNPKNIKQKLSTIPYGKALLIQNTRYEDLNGNKESNCDQKLSKEWASIGEIFVNDAFATIHRSHASNYGISCFLPSVTGLLIEQELTNLNKLDSPEKPFIIIMGGSKISDKSKVIESLINKTEYILIGGAMANNFIKAQGYEIGQSLIDNNDNDLYMKLLNKYKEKIILPIDFSGEEDKEKTVQKVGKISKNFTALDIGPQTIKKYKEILKEAKTIFWNGPLGKYEDNDYIKGTKEILEFAKDNIKTVIIGGGDIVAASNLLEYTKDLTFASTGGGATLKYIENHNQPGLKNII